MKTKWTEAEWLATRARRRRVTNLVSPEPCGRKTSRNDAELREAFQGRRNRPFASLEELERFEREAADREKSGDR